MVLVEMRSVKITGKGQIAIPKEIRELEGFKEGTKIAMLAYKDRIELRPLNKINEKRMTAVISEKALAKDWMSKEDERAWETL